MDQRQPGSSSGGSGGRVHALNGHQGAGSGRRIRWDTRRRMAVHPRCTRNARRGQSTRRVCRRAEPTADVSRPVQTLDRGALRPWRLSIAMNKAGIEREAADADGADVISAQSWENGTVYPTWDQFVRFSALTNTSREDLFSAPASGNRARGERVRRLASRTFSATATILRSSRPP
jgi:hypothetical protein